MGYAEILNRARFLCIFSSPNHEKKRKSSLFCFSVVKAKLWFVFFFLFFFLLLFLFFFLHFSETTKRQK